MDRWARQELDQLIAEIEAEVRYTADYTGRKALAPDVMAVMARVARHDFVDGAERELAYANHPLSIGHGQTISQPYIVALMTDLMDIDRDSKVLEVGTGSGYQAAILAELAGQVFSIEIIPELAAIARKRLARMGYDNITVMQGNGRLGWPEHAPFDAIMVTAAAEVIPEPLVDQLKPGGRLVIPVGSPWGGQELLLVTKEEDGTIHERRMLPVAFVPLTGRSGERSDEGHTDV
jgi:protein-L-isoaspartate(D-aspartate) O-methyltransferase